MDLDSVARYLHETHRTPYFLFVSNENFREARAELGAMGLREVRFSTLCKEADRLPFFPDACERLQERASDGECLLLLGLGEYFALRGEQEAHGSLLKLKDLSCRKGAIVILLRSVFSLAHVFQHDPRMVQGERRVSVRRMGCDTPFSLTVFSPGLSAEDCLEGVHALLARVEEGAAGMLYVCSRQTFPYAEVAVRRISSAYEAIRFQWRAFSVPEMYGTEAEWHMLFQALSEYGDFSAVLAAHGLSRPLITDFHARASAEGFPGWLYFVALRQAQEEIAGSYLAFVLESAHADTLASAFVSRLADVPLSDTRFARFYAERKAALKDFSEAELSTFVAQNRRESSERIFRLTDVTMAEREDMIAALASDAAGSEWADRCDAAAAHYPALADYARDYAFQEGVLAKQLTAYFAAYKRQKLRNEIEPDFIAQIEELATRRIYNALPTREALLEQVPLAGSLLFWVDALGVEYLSLISACAKRLGLQIRVQAARSMLPTITRVNRGFYDMWTGAKEKEDRLDELKHKETSRYNYTVNTCPIHLAREIDLIEEVMERIARLLHEGVQRVILTSDHGASRLAVLANQEATIETEMRGEHSGRCARLGMGGARDLPFATEENGYLVLADYERFRGSRKANVEVHGGASLEEVVVPLLIVSLREGALPNVRLVEGEMPTADARQGLSLCLFTDQPVSGQRLSILWEGVFYPGEQQDGQHFRVRIPGILHSGTYPIEVYLGEDLLSRISVKAAGKGMQVNDDFDF